MIAPLSLSNVLTVLVALLCSWTMSPQARGGVVKTWRLAVPPCFAGVQAMVLLAGVFDAKWQHDMEWLAGLLLGAAIGHVRGWKLTVAVDQMRGLILLPRTNDGRLVALALVGLAGIDFLSAYLEDPIIEPQHIAALAAMCAGYLGARALSVVVRSIHSPHVELSPTTPDRA